MGEIADQDAIVCVFCMPAKEGQGIDMSGSEEMLADEKAAVMFSDEESYYHESSSDEYTSSDCSTQHNQYRKRQSKTAKKALMRQKAPKFSNRKSMSLSEGDQSSF